MVGVGLDENPRLEVEVVVAVDEELSGDRLARLQGLVYQEVGLPKIDRIQEFQVDGADPAVALVLQLGCHLFDLSVQHSIVKIDQPQGELVAAGQDVELVDVVSLEAEEESGGHLKYGPLHSLDHEHARLEWLEFQRDGQQLRRLTDYVFGQLEDVLAHLVGGYLLQVLRVEVDQEHHILDLVLLLQQVLEIKLDVDDLVLVPDPVLGDVGAVIAFSEVVDLALVFDAVAGVAPQQQLLLFRCLKRLAISLDHVHALFQPDLLLRLLGKPLHAAALVVNVLLAVVLKHQLIRRQDVDRVLLQLRDVQLIPLLQYFQLLLALEAAALQR